MAGPLSHLVCVKKRMAKTMLVQVEKAGLFQETLTEFESKWQALTITEKIRCV